MLRDATEDQVWEVVRHDWRITEYDVRNFVLREYDKRYNRRYVIPKKLPLYANGEFLNPASFIDDANGRLRQTFGITFEASRLRFMIGHCSGIANITLSKDEDEPYQVFYPAHYLAGEKADNVLVVAEFDQRLGLNLQAPGAFDKSVQNLESVIEHDFYNEGKAKRRIDFVFAVDRPERQEFVEQVLHQLQEVVDYSDGVMQKFEAEKGFYRKSFERLVGCAIAGYGKADCEIKWRDDELEITEDGGSPGIKHIHRYRYNNDYLGILQLDLRHTVLHSDVVENQLNRLLSDILQERDQLFNKN